MPKPNCIIASLILIGAICCSSEMVTSQVTLDRSFVKIDSFLQSQLSVQSIPGIAIAITQGDRIVYKSYSTTEVKVSDSEYILIKEEDILATVK